MNFARPKELRTPLTTISACFSSRARPINHYGTLDVDQDATQEEIKTAYYKLTKKYHPDVNKTEEAKIKFRDVSEAYEILGNYKARRKYDRGMVARGTVVRSPIRDTKEPEHMAFYKSRMKSYPKPVRTSDTKVYDFDAWTRAHYGDTLKRTISRKQTNIKTEIDRQKEPRKQKRLSNEFAATLGLTMIILLAVMLAETRDDFDTVIIKSPEEGEVGSER